MQKFCHHCGKGLEITAKFCSSCGTSLASLSNKPEPATPKQPNFVLPTSADNDEDDDGDSLQHFDLRLSALAVDIDARNTNVERMGFIQEQNATKQRGRPKKKS